MSFRMYVPTRIVFGAGMLNKLSRQKMPGKKAMIVISNGKSTRANGSLDRTIAELDKAGVESVVFDKIMANPLKSTVMEGGAFAKENGCDFIVALGGGSVMDASKAIATMATNDGDLWDYVYGGTGKGQRIPNDPLPIVAITTTAGTGSEVDQYGVISNEETNEKIGFGGDDRLFPCTAIVDPELMKSVPPKFTAYQGFDALFHSVEGYISNACNEAAEMIELTAIRNIAEYLPTAVKNGSDLTARTKVAFANTLSGYSMELSSCVSEHSMEHALSGHHHSLPHGAGLIMISVAYFTKWIEKHVCDDRFVDMAKALGKTDASTPEDFIDALKDLQKACGVDDLKMSDYGITPDEFETMAKDAKRTMLGLFLCDRFEMSDSDVVSIYRDSYR